MTPSLTATLDRIMVSDRCAVMIVADTAKILGHDINELALNRSTLKRERMKSRKEQFQQMFENFDLNSSFLVVHWDGKMMKDITGQETVDRLPILVSMNGCSKLLSVPMIQSGTGENQANAVIETLNMWGITDNVQALSFDTTSSNTGRHNGACILIEQKLKKNMFYFACRHHVLELILGAAFSAVLKGTSGPEVTLFKRFKDQWKHIDETKFMNAETEDFTKFNTDDIKETLTTMQGGCPRHYIL